MTIYDPIQILETRAKDLDSAFSYKLASGQYAISVPFDKPDIDESKMSVWITFASGERRDGVGDLTEVGGIVTERHRKNPIVLFDHGKSVVLPIGLAEDPETKEYSVLIDEQTQVAKGNCFFYQGKNLPVGAAKDHALFCEQLFDLIVNGIIRAGSFAYSIIRAEKLYADYETGTPAGLHLLKTLLLEFGPTVLPASPDTVRKMKEYPLVCGKSLHPCIVKSFEPFAVENTKTVTGYEKGIDTSGVSVQEASRVLKESPPIPPAKWKPGVGTVKAMATPAEAKVMGAENYRNGVAYERCPFVAAELKLIWQDSWKEAYKVDHGKPYPLQKAIEKPTTTTTNQTRNYLSGRNTFLPSGGFLQKPTLPGRNDWKALRNKYRRVKAYRRRHRKAMPGSSFIYVNRSQVPLVQKSANQNNLKCQCMGPSKNLPDVEKIKLTGDDEAIDKVAREYGKAIKRGFKSMTVKNKKSQPSDKISPEKAKQVLKDGEVRGHKLTEKQQHMFGAAAGKKGKKSMQEDEEKKDLEKVDDGTEVEVGGDEKAESNDEVADEALEQENGDEAPEKYSAQVLRTMHKDAQILMQQYDEMRKPLEHEEVDGLLERKLQDLVEDLEEIESLFAKHHPDLPELEGAGAKDMGEAEVEEEDTGDEAATADSEEEDLPDAYEAVEGMNKKQQKDLRTKYTKSMEKCAKCGMKACKCAGMKSAEMPVVPDKADDTEGSFAGEDKVEPGDEPKEKNMFAPHEKENIKGAAGYCGELATEQNFGDEHRMKAYYWHKSLEPLHAQAAEGTDPATQPGNEEYQMKSAEAGTPVAEPKDCEHGSLSMAEKRSQIGNASMFLRKMSMERAFGDQHRAEAAHHAKTLNPLAMEAEEQGVQEGHAPGEMGEKDMDDEEEVDEKKLHAVKSLFENQGKSIAQLTKTLETLSAKLVRV